MVEIRTDYFRSGARNINEGDDMVRVTLDVNKRDFRKLEKHLQRFRPDKKELTKAELDMLLFCINEVCGNFEDDYEILRTAKAKLKNMKETE